MDVMQRYPEIVEAYPEYVTQQQFCKICGICKSKAYQLQKKGIIPYEKKVNHLLHTHSIRLSDVLEYKYRQERESSYDEMMLNLWQKFYKQQLKSYPDIVSTTDAEAITGYTDTSIQRWILSGLLRAFLIKERLKIPKLSLIEFMTSPYYYKIRVKSKKHKETVQLFDALLLRHSGEGKH